MSTQAQSVSEMAAPLTAKEKAALLVWGFDVPAVKNAGFFLELPAGARITGVARNAGDMSAKVYAVVNPQMAREKRFFYVAQTNFPLPDPTAAAVWPEPELWRFDELMSLGTYVGWGQTLHLFELVKAREPGAEG